MPHPNAPLRRRHAAALLAACAWPRGRAVAQSAAPAESQAARTIVVFGDSQAQGVAAALRRATRHTPGVTVIDRTRPGTAISQPGYDWPAAIHAYAAGEHAAVAVMMFGGNDRLPVRPERGPAIAFRSEGWEALYRSRVADMLTTLTGLGMRVIWLGEPLAREAKYSQDMEYLNGIYQDVLGGDPVAGGASFLSLWTVVADDAGRFAAYGRGPGGATERLRLDDGIHFTPAGYDLIAARVLAAITAQQAAR